MFTRNKDKLELSYEGHLAHLGITENIKIEDEVIDSTILIFTTII